MAKPDNHPPRTCQICGAQRHLRPASFIRPALVELIQKEHSNWNPHGWICDNDVHRYRNEYIRALLVDEQGEISSLEKEVLESIRQQEVLARDPAETLEANLTSGQRLADRIAEFGGSWPFIGIFGVVLVAWMTINSVSLLKEPFDPYPYILLNLVLSCLAAIQAPVIMMSQNRQEERDRLQAQHDYQVNLKAELEVRHLNQKLDHMMSNQWERLVEIQQVQMELMEEVRQRK